MLMPDMSEFLFCMPLNDIVIFSADMSLETVTVFAGLANVLTRVRTSHVKNEE